MAVAVTGVGLVWAQIETAARAPLPCSPAAAVASPSAAPPTPQPDDQSTPDPAATTIIPPRRLENGGADPVSAVSPAPTPTATPPEGIVEDTSAGQAVPTPAPVVTPAPCPKTHHPLLGSGPVTFSGNGGLDLGEHSTSTTNGYNQNQSEVGLSMLFELARRTEQTSLVIDQGVGGSQSQYDLSQVNIGYSTPKYIASFGPVNGPNDTQLSNGSYNRGLTLTVPHGRDEIDLIAARTTGSTGDSFSVGGIRHSKAFGKGLLFSQAFYLARGDEGGNDELLDLALGRYKTGATYRGEVAFSSAHGLSGVGSGVHAAYALHADLSGKTSTTSLAFTSIPDDFAALGQVQYAQRSFLGSYRKSLRSGGDFTNQISTISSDVGGETSSTQQQTGGLDLPFFFHGTMNLNETLALSGSDGESTLNRTAGMTLSEIFAGTGVSQTVSLSSYSSYGSAPSVETSTPGAGSQAQFQLSLSRSLFHGYLTSQYSRNVYDADGAQTRLNTGGFSYDHPVGRKADVAYSYEVQRVNTQGGDASLAVGLSGQTTQTISITRRLSPMVALRILEGQTTQVGVGGGSARYVNVDVVGPLAIGNAARYTGRVNPNLPAVVTGHVFLVQASSSYGLVGNTGIPGVLVTLDGGVTQRTDSNGAYQFQFVKAGLHTMTIADATLPVGSIADTSTQSFTVQGGQVATVDFAAGAFAGIGGSVLDELGGGGTAAIPGIDIIVDGQQHGYTDPTGHYQIGHLQPGKHTVAINADSLPATVELDGPTSQNVEVFEGKISTLDWKVEGLGSIQGSVLYAANAGFGNLEGAKNIYVVAEPGDRAAITDEDGNFVIDNVPSGDYTLSLDADTIPDGEGITQSPEGTVSVTANNAVDGLLFKLGPVAKAVVFSFNGSAAVAPVSANFSPARVPDGAIVTLHVTTTQKNVRSVAGRGQGLAPIVFVKEAGEWVAKVFIPETLPVGDHIVRITVTGGKGGSADATLTIDPKISLVVEHSQPSHPKPGELVQVALRVLADVGEGDKVYFEDGQSATLGAPSGRVYSFTVRMWSKPGPYQGLLITRRGQRIQFTIQAAAPQ